LSFIEIFRDLLRRALSSTSSSTGITNSRHSFPDLFSGYYLDINSNININK
jgi:hypothetical protein